MSCQLGSVAQHTRTGTLLTSECPNAAPPPWGRPRGAFTSVITSHEPSAGRCAIEQPVRCASATGAPRRTPGALRGLGSQVLYFLIGHGTTTRTTPDRSLAGPWTQRPQANRSMQSCYRHRCRSRLALVPFGGPFSSGLRTQVLIAGPHRRHKLFLYAETRRGELATVLADLGVMPGSCAFSSCVFYFPRLLRAASTLRRVPSTYSFSCAFSSMGPGVLARFRFRVCGSVTRIRASLRQRARRRGKRRAPVLVDRW